MFKALILLKRKPETGFPKFCDWLLNHHAKLARDLPGVRELRYNVSAGDGQGEFDAVAELWFDSQDAFQAAYATEHGKGVAADSLAHVSRRERMFVSEHRIVSPVP